MLEPTSFYGNHIPQCPAESLTQERQLFSGCFSLISVVLLQVVQLLVEVPTFTEYLDSNSQANLQLVTETEVELLESKPLFGRFGF